MKRNAVPVRIQIESPLDDDASTDERQTDRLIDDASVTGQDAQAKGPFSGIVPGGESTTAAAAPSAESSAGPSLPTGGMLSGLPGAGLAGGSSQADGQTPTMIIGGFSALVIPMRGMSLSNMASMMSAGQQFGQMLPKP